MGVRGPLPAPTGPEPEPLQKLDPPSWLGKEARAHWRKYAAQLAKRGDLNSLTADSFALVCDLWERLCTLRGEATDKTYIDSMKLYATQSKPFRLVPCERQAKPTDRHADKKPFKMPEADDDDAGETDAVAS